jgi:hypothetical protein
MPIVNWFWNAANSRKMAISLTFLMYQAPGSPKPYAKFVFCMPKG